LKYRVNIGATIHVGAVYKFNNSNGGAGGTAVQGNLGGEYAGLAVDAFYSRIDDAVSLGSLTAAQVADLPKLGFASTNSLSATISDNTAYAVMAAYQISPIPVKLFAGYEHIQYANPAKGVPVGTSGLGGYIFAFVNGGAYADDKALDVYWGGVRYSILPGLDATAAYYGYRQNAYGTGAQAGCSTDAHSTCSGSFRAYSVDAVYRFTRRLDGYAGIMYSAVSDGLASGYLYDTTNINPTIGVRYTF
jgi:hypothetical protein